MTKKGIDVSKWQGNINWSKVKNSGKVDFAILRAGYGSSTKDAKFETYYRDAKAQGIPLGVYWYNYATTVSGAVAEAKACINALKGKQFEYPIYYDIEENATFKTGRANVSNIAKAFCDELEKAGYFTGIYSSKSAFGSYFTDEAKQRYTIWLAHVNVSKSNYTGAYDIWQYSWKGNIAGISGDVDLDYCYKDFPSIIKGMGKNGFVAEKSPDTNATTPTTTEAPKPSAPAKLYNVKVICNALNVRTGPGMTYPAVQIVKKNEIYSIVEEKNAFGRLISGAGWISLNSKYVKKI